jgi:hypothetical protein
MEQEIKETEEVQITTSKDYDLAEWVCQFDDDEPIVIAWSNSKENPGELSFTLKPNSDSNIIFRSADGTKSFKVFSRSMTKEKRDELGLSSDTEETPS